MIQTENTALSPVHEELLNLGERVRAWQLAQYPPVSDAQMLARFPLLGSSRHYKRIHTGTGIEGVDGDEWLNKYQRVWEAIKSEAVIEEAEPVYDDLSPIVAVRAAVAELYRQTGNQRLVVVQGDTSVGKTISLEGVRTKYGRTAYLIEAHEGWGSLTTALKSFAAGLAFRKGDDDEREPTTVGGWIELIIRKLNARGRRVILLDECQHWSGGMLNVVKTLINRTDSVFVVAAMGTLWEKLNRSCYAESKQLTLNRMLKRVKLEGPSYDDAEKLLSRRAGVKPGKELINRLLDLADTRGHFAFIRRTIKALNEQEAETKAKPVEDRMNAAVTSVLEALQVD